MAVFGLHPPSGDMHFLLHNHHLSCVKAKNLSNSSSWIEDKAAAIQRLWSFLTLLMRRHTQKFQTSVPCLLHSAPSHSSLIKNWSTTYTFKIRDYFQRWTNTPIWCFWDYLRQQESVFWMNSELIAVPTFTGVRERVTQFIGAAHWLLW